MKPAENYKPKYTSQSFSDSRNLPDSYWNYQQKKGQSLSFNRNGRNTEAPVSYYSSSTSYKPTKGHVCSNPTYPRCVSPHAGEVSQHRSLQGHSKLGRDKHYTPNVSTKSKPRYDDELGNTEKFKYINEELGNFTDDNADEEVEDEEDDNAEAGEFLNKEYDEQEADDEIDEESDPSPQTHRAQRASMKEADARQPRWRATDQQQDPRRHRCQQRVLAVGQGHSLIPRYYHNVAEHEVPEPLSEEDFVRTSKKNLLKRSTDYHQWSPSRGEPDRYVVTPMSVQTRRARTKTEIDQLIETELGETRKCNCCGSLTQRRPESPVKTSCRFDDRVSFPTKGPIGDEPDSHEQMFCARYNWRHNPKDTSGVSDIPPSQYPMKSRKSRDVKSPTIYQVPEHDCIDQLPNEYTRASSRYHRKTMDPEKSKRSPNISYVVPRVSSRYDE
ncbi:hypothetical protein WN55_09128 [Dufourea novaeangliae]|uniref:Uncharacterized protein n=1 Tax=Dufourea novaeangliae TaxID=178035 RepID=A0A154P814_DUFNO|nr:hypothetical protein WN55_09128 [Dufourea novaeangliae]